ncbi:MAG: hypothetical protein A3C30_04400 [Candidatus Levybacteria bacterium RIFCSPHIGHO2_02_FULL_40_18]|nr:MAG: hypothetical protein A2869_01730 [Candidatus Levybacteria bacterium RIFCSPHIGHO2_01_FULL_40_58]OGH26321.1 MAG: hypothetical protein A3C30_04400 [Candidatus Levybacteria bacterium RIFCSPHIGHO2_02_FULL_40_18]OGH31280.1 MAG: hypothetical protein A3E43_02655 [Candidatus Levybacteria bacterium RIFCSPHIGHO2_12_FULL_40_31]OGH40350.1 MAG: hypothetical protein A2894_05365 [Candidatus Levybacteria bacterium RIFCSPLOWO2_01_FULL_40_64]OGH49223.1 MAG: hypothetical protein A3I54_01075 [Candidatus Lev
MKNLFRKFLNFTAIFILLIGLFSKTYTLPLSVLATSQDQCNQVFTYEKSSDFNDSRVNINFENSDEQIDVSADPGYEITEVWLDVENDNHSGYWLYATGPVNNFNPNPGRDIEKAKVKVKKVCPDACTNIEGLQATVPSGYTANNGICTPIDVCTNLDGSQSSVPEGYSEENGVCAQNVIDLCLNIEGTQASLPDGYHFEEEGNCVEDVVEQEEPTPTPQEEENNECGEGQVFDPGLQICIDCDGEGTCEVVIGDGNQDITPTPTPTEQPVTTETPTSIPTQAPTSSSTSDTGGTGGAVEQKQGEVLGVSTVAATGDSRSVLATIEQALGLVLASLGALYGKKKVKKNK